MCARDESVNGRFWMNDHGVRINPEDIARALHALRILRSQAIHKPQEYPGLSKLLRKESTQQEYFIPCAVGPR
jgi:hypothetical protein